VARFSSTPSGAEVYVDGALIGLTPVNWTRGTSGQSYQAELRLSGYQAERFKLTFPEGGSSESFRRSLSQVAAAPGKVSVNVKGGWANVYIDGANVGQTPLSNHALPAGTHTVRVNNPETGLDETKQVTVTAGETSRLMF